MAPDVAVDHVLGVDMAQRFGGLKRPSLNKSEVG